MHEQFPSNFAPAGATRWRTFASGVGAPGGGFGYRLFAESDVCLGRPRDAVNHTMYEESSVRWSRRFVQMLITATMMASFASNPVQKLANRDSVTVTSDQ